MNKTVEICKIVGIRFYNDRCSEFNNDDLGGGGGGDNNNNNNNNNNSRVKMFEQGRCRCLLVRLPAKICFQRSCARMYIFSKIMAIFV